MKTKIVAAMIVCLSSGALAESGSSVITVGSGLSGSVIDQLTFTVPQPPASLIRSGTRGTIKYFGSAPFFLPMAGRVGVDLNRDGTDDFSFGGGQWATASIPPSISSWWDILTSGSNQVLASGSFVAGYGFGTWIQDDALNPFLGAGWTNRENPITVSLFTSTYLGDSWHGSLGPWGISYVGVRFLAADGLHYGWIRVRLPEATTNLFQSGQPAALDWAYETRTNTPIRAGVVSTARRQNEFFIALDDGNGRPGQGGGGIGVPPRSSGYGSAFLSEGILRYEVHFFGVVTNARLVRFGAAAGRTKPLSVLDFPRIPIHLPCRTPDPTCGSDRTTLFGEIKLNALQMALLQRGQLGISAADGTLTGTFHQSSGFPLGSPIPRQGNSAEVPFPTLPPVAGGGSGGSVGVEATWASGDYTSALPWISVLPVDITNRAIIGPVVIPSTAGQ